MGGCYDTCWLTGLWSTQTKVEGIVPRAPWHWVEIAVLLTIPLGKQAALPLYVGLPSAWDSLNGELIFFPIRRRAPVWGLPQTYVNE